MQKIDQTTQNKGNKDKKSRLHFPNLRSIIIESIETAKAQSPDEFEKGFGSYEKVFEKFQVVRRMMEDKDPQRQQSAIISTKATYQAQLPFEEVVSLFKTISVRPNEFYAIFNLLDFRYEEVDPSIKNLLGIEPNDFTVNAMIGLCDDNPLFHEKDLNHVLRWVSVAFCLFTLELIKWTSMQDQYRVRFRAGTLKSKLATVTQQDYVTLEKLCFMFYDKVGDGLTQPIYHFDKWLVYPESEFDYVRPSILSTASRQTFLNDMLYLMNAYTIDIPTQYLLYLHERSCTDRNKTVAHNLSANLKRYANIDQRIYEQHVADCFAKTIRNRLAQAMNIWDKRKFGDLLEITNDQEAVHCAKVLGLLPIPKNVLESLYRNVDLI
jgi:hypothetical protein